jgi:hypothetical protein
MVLEAACLAKAVTELKKSLRKISHQKTPLLSKKKDGNLSEIITIAKCLRTGMALPKEHQQKNARLRHSENIQRRLPRKTGVMASLTSLTSGVSEKDSHAFLKIL